MPIRSKTARLASVDVGQTATSPGFGIAGVEDELESLRVGTRQQYESSWVLIPDPTATESTRAVTFTHDFGEVPWVVDVLEADSVNGLRERELSTAATITIAKDTTTITLTRTNGGGAGDLWFKVRAM